MHSIILAAPGTGHLQSWIVSNIVPLLLVTGGLLALVIGGHKGDHGKVMKLIAGCVVGLGVVGLALTGAGVSLGKWLANLIANG